MPQVDGELPASWEVVCFVFCRTFRVGESLRLFLAHPPGCRFLLADFPLLNHQATNQSSIKLSQLPEEKNVMFSKF